MKPKRRTERLVVEKFADESLVYDQERQVAHCLNRTAALTWDACDGDRDIAALATHVSSELGSRVEEAAVRLALRQLSEAGLMEAAPASDEWRGMSRRAMLGRVTGVACALLPLVTTLPVAAQSALGSCISAGRCIPGLTECMPCHGGDPAQCGSKRCRGGNCVLASSTSCGSAPAVAAPRSGQTRRR